MSLEANIRNHAPQIVMVASSIIAIAKYGPVAWKVFMSLIRLTSALEAIALLPKRVDALAAQFERNGGSSLRDAVDRTNASVKSFGEALEELNIRGRTRWRMDYGVPGWEADDRGRWISANTKLCDMFEVSEEDLTGMNWKNIVYHQDADKLFAAWERVVRESSHLNTSARCLTSCGDLVHIRFKAHAMKINGRVVGWIGTAAPESDADSNSGIR